MYKDHLEFSVVVPTMNRSEDLKELFQSILRQILLPKEVIVVDDSNDDKVKILVEQVYDDFSRKNVALKYLRGAGKGISAARNMGLAKVTGTVYCGVDDDVVLDKDYLKEISEVYQKYPTAIGVGGFIPMNSRRPISSLENSLRKVFFLFHIEEDGCRMLPSGKPTYPSHLSKVITCDYLTGNNSCYRMQLLRDFEYDENLEGYSLGEDIAFSYSIQMRYANSLYMTPRARVVHKESPSGRKTKHLVNISTAYPTFFYYSYMRHTILNFIIFIWSMLGYFCTRACSMLKKKPSAILFLIHSYIRTVRHLKEIINGSLSFVR